MIWAVSRRRGNDKLLIFLRRLIMQLNEKERLAQMQSIGRCKT